MQTVYLNGGIAQFGTKWSTNCANIGDVFKLIECQTPGFRRYLIDAAENNVDFEIQRGEEFLESGEELLLSLRNEDIIITEVPAGAKDGASKIIAAVAIIVVIGMSGGQAAGWPGFKEGLAAAFTAGGEAAWYVKAAAMIATNLALQGVTQLLSPGPETDDDDTNKAYLFNGPVTSAPEGMAVPVLYGELIVGGRPVSINYQENSPFADGDDIWYEDPLTGAQDDTASITVSESNHGIGFVTAVNNETGLPLVTAPTIQPSLESLAKEIQDDNDDKYEINVPVG